ncbi:MAG: HlyD family type I secretion periplasmic adaptor subunit [Pseudomonadota bacterium]
MTSKTKAIAAPGPAAPAGDPGADSVSDGWAGRGFWLVGMISVLVLGGGFGGWAATATLAGAVVSQGQLRVESQRQVVQHAEGGIVGQILVTEGEQVEAGETLIRLDGTSVESELAALESQLFEIMARRGRLQAEQAGRDTILFDPELMAVAAEQPEVAALVDGQRSLFEARRRSVESELKVFDERQAQIEQQIQGVEAEIAALVRQKELAGDELADVQGLADKGLARRDRLMALEREAARLLGQEGQRIARKAELYGSISELEEEQLRVEASRREEAISELRELGFRELELRERRIQLQDRRARLDIRAPMTGYVYDMQVFALKAVIQGAEPVLYIVPSDSSLIVEARVEPANIDQVYEGQEAVLRLVAFNARTTPEIFGTVVNISADAFVQESTGQSFYKVDVSIRPEEFAKLEGKDLVAGMPVEVYLQTGERTPLAYLVKPMTDYVNRAWREE